MKFYQCLLAKQLPMKVRKLCVVGPSDSGKSTWASVLLRLTQKDASIYITCNQLPIYGAEQENVMRRLEIFETVSLVNKSLEAPAWIEEHAFEILVWIAMVINGNIGMIPNSERFFEKPIEQFLRVKVKAFCQFNSLKPNKYMKTSNFTKYKGKALPYSY